MTPTQEYIVNKMRKAQEEQGCFLGDTRMLKLNGCNEELPTWICDYPNGKQVVYSINKAGYNVHQRNN